MDFLRKVPEEKLGIMPTYPAQTLALHCAAKGAQVGSCVGLGLTAFTAVACTLIGRKRPQAWKRLMVPSTILGTLATSGLLYYKHSKDELDEAAVDDRALRIANNAEQIKVDKYGLTGFAVGAVGGVIAGQNILSLSCTGIALGVMCYLAETKYNDDKKKKASAMFKPSVEEE